MNSWSVWAIANPYLLHRPIKALFWQLLGDSDYTLALSPIFITISALFGQQALLSCSIAHFPARLQKFWAIEEFLFLHRPNAWYKSSHLRLDIKNLFYTQTLWYKKHYLQTKSYIKNISFLLMLQHILYKNPIPSRRIIHQHMSHRPHQLSILNNGTATPLRVK